MAEERNLATARAPEAAEGEAADPTKAELQRRMDEARESITQTVHEIKETVSSQYQNVRETISQSLDWREQYRRRPLAFTAGAIGVGALVGYSVGGALFGDSDDLTDRYYEAEGEYDDDDVSVSAADERRYPPAASGAYGSTIYARAGQASADSAAEAFDRGLGRQQEEGASYGAQQQADGHTYRAAPAAALSSAEPRPSYSSGYEASSTALAASSAPEEPKGPGLFERFKETQAYDRLQAELQTLGGRAVEELSKTAQQVVLPALLGKLKDLIGIDLSTQREVAQRSRLEQQAAHASAQADQASQSAGGGDTQPGASSGAYGGYGKTL